MYLGSDAIALAPFTDTIAYLEDGDCVVLTRNGVEVRDAKGATVERAVLKSTRPRCSSTRATIATSWRRKSTSSRKSSATRWRTISTWRPSASRCRASCRSISSKLERISISACGTAYYAGLVAKYWFERFARLPVEIDVASEFRYREAPLDAGRARDLRLAVGRDRRHAGDAALRQGAQAARRSRSSTCRPRPSRAKATSCMPTLRRARDRRCLDQGLHLPARGARLPRDRGRPRARRAVGARRAEARARADRGAAPDGGGAARSSRRSSSSRATSRRAATCSISAAARASRSRSKARSSSRKSPTSTPKAMPPASSSTGRSR